MKKVCVWMTAFLLLIGLIYGLLSYSHREQVTILSYKECRVPFKYSGTLDTLDLEYLSAQRALSGCLCELYIKTKDRATSRKIMELYSKNSYSIKPDSPIYEPYKSLDSIVKYRKSVFDTIILLD